MRLVFLTFVICFVSHNIFAQEYFEGKIEYKNTFISLDENIDAELLKNELGETCTAYIKPDR
jgi:hypothetical protein